MNKEDSWDSEFRKKKFYEKQKIKAIKIYNKQIEKEFAFPSIDRNSVVTRSIAIMLDLDGTSNQIDESTAEVFMKQVDFLRKKFASNKAYICISTHSNSHIHIKKVVDELNKFGNENIVLGPHFYLGGVYDYYNDDDFKTQPPQNPPFNINKIQTFIDYFLEDEDLNIHWFALIDDNISEDVFKKYQDNTLMVVLKPTQSTSSLYNNFMFRTTETANFFGVIELMSEYINDIKDMTPLEIFDKQKNIKRRLSSYELYKLIRNREFLKLIEYCQSGLAAKEDYNDIYKWLMVERDINPFENKYEIYIERLLNILSENEAFKETVEEAKAEIYASMKN